MKSDEVNNREKIIGNLEVIKYFFRQCRENFSLGSDVENSLFDLQEAASGAIELLKEQEAELSYRNAKTITHTATKLDKSQRRKW